MYKKGSVVMYRQRNGQEIPLLVTQSFDDPAIHAKYTFDADIFVRASDCRPATEEENTMYWRSRALFAESRLKDR